jgi:hypothetical protein
MRTDIRSTLPDRMPYSCVMARPWRTIIAGLLAFWMPLCCCQIAAIAGTAAPCCAGGPSVARASADSSCCAEPIATSSSCCAVQAAPAADCCTEDERSICCPDEPCGESAHPCGDDRSPAADPCMCCSTKAPVPEQDPVDPILSAHAASDAVPSSMLASCAVAAPVLACTGPPDGGCGALWANGPWPCAHASDRCAQLSCWTE